jgi:hypothetical protein
VFVLNEFSVEGGSLEDFTDAELMQLIGDTRMLSAGTKLPRRRIDVRLNPGCGELLVIKASPPASMP